MLAASLLGSPMTLIVLGFVVVAIIIAAQLAKFNWGKAASGQGADRYSARTAILSQAERSFAGVLDGALPDGVTWFAKVRVADIVVTKKGLSASERASAWNRVNQKHVDFLLVRSSDFAPLAGIELDDRSHERDDRKERDAFVDDVFRSCGLPLLHVPAQAAYKQTELRSKIVSVLKPA